jgi:O-antigen/teichoic acid export membrane protein
LRLFRDYAVLASGQAASRLLGLLAFAWLARILGPESYGAVEYVIGIALVGGTFVDGGSSVVGVRRATADGADLAVLAAQMLLSRVIFAALAMLLVAIVGLRGARDSVPGALVWLFAASLLFAPWRQDWLFQATGRIGYVAWGQVVRAGAFAALAWSLVRTPLDVAAVGWSEIGAVAALTVYCLCVQHARIVAFRVQGSRRGFAQLLKESAAAGVTNCLWTLSQYAPLLMIGAFVGGVQTGWFAAAVRVAGALAVVPFVYHFGLYRAVVRASRRSDELGALLERSCRVAAWGGVFLALLVTLLADQLLMLILGAKLAPAAPMLQVMTWILPVALCSGHAVSALCARGAQARVLGTQVAGLALIVAVGLVLGPAYGGHGYAIAALAGPVVRWALAHRLAAQLGLQPPAFRLALKPAALALAIVGAAAYLHSGPWLAPAWLALYLAATLLLDRRLLPDLLGLGTLAPDTVSPRQS